MRIGIIGSGSVGQVLAAGFAKKGHQVMVGTRDPAAKREALAAAAARAQVGTFEAAAQHGEVVVFCVNGAAGGDALRLAGPENLAGKVVLDTTNPLEPGPTGIHNPAAVRDSLLQQWQRTAPQARFVKAWNCVPGAMMVDPPFTAGPGTQFICGDDASAKQQAAKLLADFGWESIDLGGSDMGPYVEAMAIAVFKHGARSGRWDWGLKLQYAR
jgi:hypothetical protein